MKAYKIIENSEGFLAFAKDGKPFWLDVTNDMCSISLGIEADCAEDFACTISRPDAKGYTTWLFPKPDELTDEQALVIAKQHSELANELTQDELLHYGALNPEYLFYLNHIKKTL